MLDVSGDNVHDVKVTPSESQKPPNQAVFGFFPFSPAIYYLLFPTYYPN